MLAPLPIIGAIVNLSIPKVQRVAPQRDVTPSPERLAARPRRACAHLTFDTDPPIGVIHLRVLRTQPARRSLERRYREGVLNREQQGSDKQRQRTEGEKEEHAIHPGSISGT
jgi:hypothetical protein